MKSWIIFIATLSLSMGIIHAIDDAPIPNTNDQLTIRNNTDIVVRYILRSQSSDRDPIDRAIKAGQIDRFPGDVDMICTFSRGNEETAYQLDAGNHYTFRYDENQELDLYYGSHGRADAVDLAPYVGTPPRVFRRMLELAKIRKDDILYDLGCGDGRIVIAAARTFGSRGVGIDINPSRIKESESNAKAANVEDLTDFRQADVTNVDFSEATIVTLYLLPESNQLLRPLLEEQLQLGTTVISHNYAIPGWKDKLIDEVVMTEDDNTKHWIYVYLR